MATERWGCNLFGWLLGPGEIEKRYVIPDVAESPDFLEEGLGCRESRPATVPQIDLVHQRLLEAIIGGGPINTKDMAELLARTRWRGDDDALHILIGRLQVYNNNCSKHSGHSGLSPKARYNEAKIVAAMLCPHSRVYSAGMIEFIDEARARLNFKEDR